MSSRPAATIRRARVARWAVPVGLTLVALALRLAGLSRPHELLFDETYYVKDAWSVLTLGYEGSWPDDGDAAFEAGDVGALSPEGSFVAHPPFGKWLIALGLAALGPETAWGWRISTALIGAALVPLLYAVARRITGSVAFAGLAGGLLALDGLGISMSRIALLDTPLSFLVLLALWFALLDRPGTTARIASGAQRDRVAGPVVWRRPWIVAAGLTLGCAASVKWSALYALAVLGVALVVADALDRRRAGVRAWAPSAIGRQGPATFALLVPPAFLAYLATWTGWLATSGGYGRDGSANPLLALWDYQRAVYRFHVGVQSPHTYQSPAWEWPLLVHPTLMSRSEQPSCALGESCVSVVAALPNPLVWWLSMIAVVWLVVRLLRQAVRRTRLDGRAAFVLLGVAATFAPWLLYPSRTTFFFYAVAMLPYAILALVVVLQHLWRAREPVLLPDPSPAEVEWAAREAKDRTAAWRQTVVVVTVLAFAVGLFFLPFATGSPLPFLLYRAHLWLPTWYL
ncbi:dolichyl-phosphate-mannose--protein mannosyltransferase [Microbacterium sp. gxy059]|uniref:dolichyl-phosphate-mannose--protein mannosyltransferase n=1 Tax=Microbacterium sp. gxy059 TaxID=2957199 RepID=UPI003D96966B